MNHPFECKLLGRISDPLLQALKKLATTLEYKKPYPWELSQTDFLDKNSDEVQRLMYEINTFARAASLVSAGFSLLPKMTYGPEHSDTWVKEIKTTNAKIHIPIITNPFVGFMWPGYDSERAAFVTKMEEGEIYLYNNVAKHAVVNLAQEDRYHLLLEFGEFECAV